MGVVISKGDLPSSKLVAGVPSRIDDDDRLFSFSVEVDNEREVVLRIGDLHWILKLHTFLVLLAVSASTPV
jgi:hypothetical protein